MMPRWLRDSHSTPDPAWADADGLVALGGRIEPEQILRSYRAGVFPWASQPVPSWWSPDPRAVFEPATCRSHRSTRQSARRGAWRFTCDQAFAAVMAACAAPVPGREGTWITADFLRAYQELHRRGLAHSIEVHQGDALVGGLYGVALGGYFSGESMFARVPDAAKAALGHLLARLRHGGFLLLDGQVPTPHLCSLGAVAIPRERYLQRLAEALRTPAVFPSGALPPAIAPL